MSAAAAIQEREVTKDLGALISCQSAAAALPGRNIMHLLLVAGFALAACSEREEILPGKRIDVRVPLSESTEFVSGPEIDTVIDLKFEADLHRLRPLALPGEANYNEWTHINGTAGRRLEHLALSDGLSRIWSTSIGKGNSRKQRLVATPVFASGLIYAMDSETRVTAHSREGRLVWSRSLVPEGESAADASSGGLAFGNGILFATTGFGELHALNATYRVRATGPRNLTRRQPWRRPFPMDSSTS